MSRIVFDDTAFSYARSRRDYPVALVEWVSAQSGGIPPGWVVELGCGPGTMTVPLGTLGRRIVSLDLSRSMLGELRSRCREGEASACLARGEEVALRDDCAAMVVFPQSLHWMAREEALAESRRILVRDGLLLVAWQRWMAADSPAERLFAEGLERARPGVTSRPRRRARMEQACEGFVDGWTALGHFTTPAEYVLSPVELATFFASRAAMDLIESSKHEELREFWRREAQQRWPRGFDYLFQVEARMFRP